jgi:hypothetical protein
VCDDWPIGRDDVYSIGKAIRDRGEQVKNLTPEQLSFRAGYEQGRFDAQVERNARVSGNAKDNSVSFDEGVLAERQRIVNLLMIQHEAANGSHNYWHVAANLIQAEGEQK